jgi:protein involved in polysaccharide export with SLBB domain
MDHSRSLIIVACLLLTMFLPMPVLAQQEYVIGEGDLLRITVYDNPDLASEARVSDGKIAFPLIGEVVINEMTVSEAEKKIASLLANGYLTKPHVAVFILEFKKTVYVNGEVRNPGAYKLTKGLSVLKAITLAGGFTSKAAEGRIKIIRRNEKGEQTIKAKLDDLLEPDDIILVPESFF